MYRRLIEEGFVAVNIAVLPEVLSEDFVEHQTDGFSTGAHEGIKAVAAKIRALHSAHDVVQARAKANERSRQGVPATVARPTAKRDYLFRGLLRCGIWGLRMWGNHRRHSTYYSCQPSHQRSKDIPVDLFPFLATALFGPELTGYWRTCIEAAEPERGALVSAWPSWRMPSSNGTSDWWHSPETRRQRRPRWPTSPPCSAACRSLPARSMRRPRANYGRCSTRCSSTSSSSRPRAPSTSHSPSTIATSPIAPHRLARRTGSVPPAGFEPARPAPEAGALSPELRGPARGPPYPAGAARPPGS